MPLDPNLYKQLIETFKQELDEQTMIITKGLLDIEKNNITPTLYSETISKIFRAAHNLKGASRSLGINVVGDLAHQLESLFSAIDKKKIAVTSMLIDLTLETVDKLKIALNCYIENKALSFDLQELMARLSNSLEAQSEQQTKNPPIKTNTSNATIVKSHEEEVQSSNDSIRVSIASIDRLSAKMEEAQSNKISLMDHYAELNKLFSHNQKFSELWTQFDYFIKNSQIDNDKSHYLDKLYLSGKDYFSDLTETLKQLNNNMRTYMNDLNIISSTMQDEIRTLRLVPATSLFGTMPRYIRDISKNLNKSVEFKIHGDELKIDKMILEKLKDPITHLLRNAVDHGIETNEFRENFGKNKVGTIQIDVDEKESHVEIKITDDGAGIDYKKVADIALEKNLITQAEFETMDKNTLLNLIFMHGFSTKKTITDISGRGVGLDVVKTNIDSMNGHVSVATEVGKFTTFILRVPLSLSSERGFLLKVSQQMFVVPTSSIKAVMIIKADDIFHVSGDQAILVDGHPVKFCALNDVLNLEQLGMLNDKKLAVIILNKGWQSVAMLVDEVIGEREIVIKPLQKPLENIPCVSGGTLYGNNQVIPVLEPVELINKALNINKLFTLETQKEESRKNERPHILVVDDSITTRTLEKSVLENKNFLVTVAVNGQDAWDLLQEQSFSLVITDVSMPIMDGFTLTEHIKKSDQFRNIPVIIVTSLGSEEEKRRGVTVGANAYIVKNEFESSVLLETIEQLI